MIKRNKRLVMIGAGGHAKVCYDIAQKMNKWNEIIILDDNPENDYFEISGSISELENYIDDSDFFAAIGDNDIRESITNNLLNLKVNIISLIHPQAVITQNIEVGKGTVVMAGVVINSGTRIGEGCIINTSSSIDHDSIIDNFVHVSPGTILSGTVTIGKNTWVGAGTVVSNNINIGSYIVIGAGTVVVNNLKERGTYYGVPARMKVDE